MIEDEYRAKFKIPKEHSFILTKHDRSEKHGRDDDDFYFEERNAEDVIVATYHAWNYMSIYPPQKTKIGYKKYNIDGIVIDSDD